MSNYTFLTAEAMRTISGQWLHDKATLATLLKHPKTAALMPDVTESHQAICDALGGEDDTPLEAQLQRLREQGNALDERHDRKYRGAWMLCEAFIELADKPETAERLLALRDRLHGNGLTQVNAPWAAEAGNAESVRALLDKKTRAELAKIPSIEGRTLDDEVTAWVKAGEALGPVAAQKAAVEHQLENAADVSSGSALRTARLDWIKIARALETNLDLIKNLAPEERSAVLGLLHRSAASAERQSAARRRSADAPAQPTTPAKGTATD